MEHTVHGLRPLAVDERRPPKACDTVRAGHRHSVARCSCLFFADIHTSRRTFIVGRSSTRWTPAASDAALRLPPPPLPPLPHRRPLENLRSRGLFTARSSLALDKRSSLSALSSSLPPSSPFSIARAPVPSSVQFPGANGAVLQLVCSAASRAWACPHSPRSVCRGSPRLHGPAQILCHVLQHQADCWGYSLAPFNPTAAAAGPDVPAACRSRPAAAR